MTGAQQIRAKGVEEGIEKGALLAKKEMAKKLLQKGVSLEEISSLADLPIEEINSF